MTTAMQRLLPIVIGGIGATGQALILFHLLADCYPYKIMSRPPAEFYSIIARVGVLASPIIAVAAAWWFCLKVKARFALPAVAAFLSPLLVIFVVAHFVAGVEMRTLENLDRTTPLDVASGFAGSGLKLMAAGVGIGALCGIAVKTLSRHSRHSAQALG